MKNITKIIISAFAVIVIAFTIYLIPFPEWINTNYNCKTVAEDGSAVADHTIVLKATKYRYLLRKDVYHSIQLEVDGKIYNTSSYTSDIPFLEVEDPGVSYETIAFSFYNEASNSYRICKLMLRDDYEWIGVWVEDYEPGRYYVGSTQSSFNPAQIWEAFGSTLIN